jgi:hypothetical protein
MGAGDGAVYTTTLPPPPWGTNAMDRTLTPIVAQSSVDASLKRSGTLALWGVEIVGTEPLPEPPPQAASTAAATLAGSSRDVFEIMTFNSCI